MTITIKMTPDQARVLALYLGEDFIAALPHDDALLLWHLHRGLGEVLGKTGDKPTGQTLNLTEIK